MYVEVTYQRLEAKRWVIANDLYIVIAYRLEVNSSYKDSAAICICRVYWP